MSDTIRTFIAFELPADIRYALSKIQEDLRLSGLKVKWVRSENIHLTLKFLRNIQKNQIQKVFTAISAATRESVPIRLSAKGLGVFPGLKRPRVLWTGLIGDNGALEKLYQKLDEMLKDAGFPKEKRPFKGHLTLGRFKVKTDPKQIMDAMAAFGSFETEAFVLDRLFLFKSELFPSGPVYSKMEQVSF